MTRSVYALPEDPLIGETMQSASPPDSVEEAIQILESELSSMFGPAGKFIVQKQIEIFKNGQPLTMADLPDLIDRIANVMGALIGPALTKDFRKRSRRKCGLSI